MERNGDGRARGHAEPVVVLVPEALADRSFEDVAAAVASRATLIVVDGEHRTKAVQAALSDKEGGR